MRANEDHPHDNLNKTYYRDQINKVANTIDEILQGLKKMQSKLHLEARKKIAIYLILNTPVKEPSLTQFPGKEKSDSNEQNNKKSDLIRKKRRIYSISSLGVIIALMVLFLFSSGSTLPFSERDWILITDFENLTANPVFDKSLYTAFSLTASQSSYVNILPQIENG